VKGIIRTIGDTYQAIGQTLHIETYTIYISVKILSGQHQKYQSVEQTWFIKYNIRDLDVSEEDYQDNIRSEVSDSWPDIIKWGRTDLDLSKEDHQDNIRSIRQLDRHYTVIRQWDNIFSCQR